MKTLVNHRLILVAVLVLICFICQSQTKSSAISVAEKNSITLKFPNYTYEMDCKVMDIMNQIKDVKVVFTCVQAGILVLESESMIGTSLKEKLNQKIMERNETIHFELIELVSSTASINAQNKHQN